ncbi:Protein DEK [Zostera marina]|uniref:Protein DEK n=1 Tax=Zostera marina TaxID=29655 RepID=A0A0K9PJ17_ZOSMR|nr:Protein DEK [Zostera marina]
MSTQTLDSDPLPGNSGSSAKDVADRDEEIGDDELDETSGERKRKEIEKDAEGEGEGEGEKEEASDEKKDDEEEDGKVVKKVRKGRSVSRVPSISIDRPSRERRTVERYSASTPIPKSVPIKKGHGTKLRDIPNVFFKLSKRKADESLQHLHKILYGKKAKVRTLKRSILDFSGFVWTSNEDKEKLKFKEKLDRCVKDKLFDFCDMFDIHVAKATTKKEDILTLLLDFLQSPHVTRDVLLEEKEKTGQKRKRKARTSIEKKSGEIRRRKKANIMEEENHDEESQGEETEGDEIQDEENVDKNDVDGHDSASEDTVLEKEKELDKSESEEKHLESDPDTVQQSSQKKEVNKGNRSIANEEKENSESKVNTSKINSKASSSEKSTPTKKAYVSRAVSKSKDDKSKNQENLNASSKNNNVNKKQVTEAKSQSKSPRGRRGNGSGKKATGKSVIAEPSSEELRSAVSDILKEVDFNVATLADILRQLATQFGTDLTHKKSEVKGIIEDVVSNMTDSESESGEEEATETEGDAAVKSPEKSS